jgi:hypothetical protein
LNIQAHDRIEGAGRSVPLQQSAAYGEALAAAGCQVARLPVGSTHAVQLTARTIAGVRLVLANRGPLPVGDDVAADVDDRLFRVVRASFGRCLLLWSPAHPIRQTRCFRPVVSGYATVWVDLSPDLARMRRALDGKWRNQLRRAEGQGLAIREAHQGPRVAWLGERHREHRRKVGYRALPMTFLERMANASPGCRDRLVLVAEQAGQPVAGIWLQIHHGSATYMIGYADEAGRRADAMRLLLWREMLALQERGVGWLDLGGIATDRAPGLSRFKLGTGGILTIEGGTFFRPLL